MNSPRKAPLRHARTKSGLPDDEQPLLAGWLARESGVVDKLLNRRYGALYASVLCTYRKETDEVPSKTWPVSREMAIGDVSSSKYHLRHPNTSTLMAVARGAYEELDMWAFTLTWPSTSSFLGSDSLTLAFDSKEKAEEWRRSFMQASEAMEPLVSFNQPGPSTATGFADAATPSATQDGLAAVQGAATGEPKKAVAATDSRRKARTWDSYLHINGVAGRRRDA